MTIEEKMEFLKRAVEMGADVTVNFHGIIGEKQAEKIAADFSQMLDTPYEQRQSEGTYWFNLKDYSKGVKIAVFYELSREEMEAALRKQLDELVNKEETTV